MSCSSWSTAVISRSCSCLICQSRPGPRFVGLPRTGGSGLPILQERQEDGFQGHGHGEETERGTDSNGRNAADRRLWSFSRVTHAPNQFVED